MSDNALRCRKCGKMTLVRTAPKCNGPLRWSCVNVYCDEHQRTAAIFVGNVRVLSKPKE